MKYPVILFLTFLAFSCSQATDAKHAKQEKSPDESQNSTSSSEEQKEIEVQLSDKFKTYNGTWFSIDYPENMIASPQKPVHQDKDYSYVETDEARFKTPNGELEFFVYSPQWGGEPKSYLSAAANESLVAQKQESSKTDSTRITTLYTFKDKRNGSTRSAISIKTESTHLVFGIKYANDALYKQGKPAYERFKKSLKQYAD